MKIALLLAILLITSCGPGFHVKRAKYHLMKAEMKGASVKQDTVFKEIVLKVPGVKVEFIPKPLVVNDTLYFERDRVVTKVLVKNVPGKTNTVYVTTDCPDARIESKVPITVNQKITAKKGISWQSLLLYIIIAFIAGVVFKTFLPLIRKLVIGV
jgi:hypothetical protein